MAEDRILTEDEDRIVDDLVNLIDYSSRVLYAQPWSYYQWDKLRQLGEAVERLRNRLGGDEFPPPVDAVDAETVEAEVAGRAQSYALGRAMYPGTK